MNDKSSEKQTELSVDVDNLHREEVFTDLRAASVRRLLPVKADGEVDKSRPVTYIGETTLVTQLGPLPVQFAIEADSLKEAFDKFPEGVREAVDRLNERAKEMVREEASRIVVPQGVPPGMAGGPGGGLPGGGRAGGLPGGKIILDK
ncbi:MAG: hypothetical protein R3286_01725 [Gammaproteobacteria bacterium]|nr:hypothetical protein [Gammaproteobacteria bacterium]